ncbi:hypothetical protein BDV96DRAFT_667517 [Lophiotrema nucula]|uniref:General transcription factor TFIIB n=1 Tax=Lophiotrema nucula TaxID=690887 RepID=A0A6A5YTM5_9PLEO|nr:hypothetical protein BDV96DRAFT_667517 [Lophiotrema nucula]
MASDSSLSPGEVAMHGSEQQSNKAPEYEDLNILMICPDCQENPPNLVEEYAQGEIVCGSCGRVLDDHVLDTRQEWRDYSNDYGEQEDHSRVGQAANPLYFGSQLFTEIGAFSGGAKLSKRERGLARAQMMANKESDVEKANQKLALAYNKINTLCQAAGFQKIVQEQACLLYKEFCSATSVKSIHQAGLIASVILFATRSNDNNRSAESICQLVGIDRKVFGAAFKKMRKQLHEIVVKQAAAEATSQKPQDPKTAIDSRSMTSKNTSVKFVPGICSKLGITGRLLMQCEQAAEIENQHAIGEGKRPQTRAAACILLVCRELGKPLDEKQLAKHASVGVATIKKLYKDSILPAAPILINPAWRPNDQTPLLLPA